MIVEATQKNADLRIDGMLAYRVKLAGARTILDSKTYQRVLTTSIQESERTCLVGELNGETYIWYDHAPVLNTDRATRLTSDQSTKLALHARTNQNSARQGNDQGQEIPQESPWIKSPRM